MKVYMSRKLNAQYQMTPIAIETNLAWALSYWQQRKLSNPAIFWEIV